MRDMQENFVVNRWLICNRFWGLKYSCHQTISIISPVLKELTQAINSHQTLLWLIWRAARDFNSETTMNTLEIFNTLWQTTKNLNKLILINDWQCITVGNAGHDTKRCHGDYLRRPSALHRHVQSLVK